ncbi:MAG: hypothetical protein ACOYMW_07290 [Candidatus Competibacteraceae bacterium]
MKDFVADIEKIGQLLRINDEKRHDKIASVLEANPDKAVFDRRQLEFPRSLSDLSK